MSQMTQIVESVDAKPPSREGKGQVSAFSKASNYPTTQLPTLPKNRVQSIPLGALVVEGGSLA